MSARRLLLATLPLLLAACATTGTGPRAATAPAHPPTAGPQPAADAAAQPPRVSPYAPAQEDPGKRGDYVAGGLFRPGVPDQVPDEIPDVDAIPEPEVRDEPLARTGNRDYVVLGHRYHVLDDPEGYEEEGQASYYGKKFHGRRTSSAEVYDMYAFTAAHRTLPLPSYARVTNLDNGRSIIVRINDRGPFHSNRIIDLSYAAAVKLGYRERGTAHVRVEALTPADVASRRTPSAMDRLVAGLPADAPDAATAPTTAPTTAPIAATAPAAHGPAATAVVGPAASAEVGPVPPADVGPAATAAARPAPAARAVASAPNALAAPAAPVLVGPAAPAPAGNRFYMQQGGRNMSAGEFDNWMRARGIHVATGRPAPLPARAPTSEPATRAVATLAPVPAAAAAPPAAAIASEPLRASPAMVAVAAGPAAGAPPAAASAPVIAAQDPAVTADAIVLQVGSFNNEANAQHALAVLLRAAIARARLLVADVGGRHVWRLRVGPVDPESVAELAARIEGLGLGRPLRVTD